ncbi:MAG: 16S rRNA (cytosine(1402)-N(4))-methyltransferase RsmH [Pseudorhodobacter sp.]
MSRCDPRTDRPDDAAPHVPVLIGPLIDLAAPVTGHWLDGTFGAGGYARALLEAGADRVTGLDRDPLALELASGWIDSYGNRLQLVGGVFSELDRLVDGPLDGIVFDLGVSSMQLDRAARGFSFQKDGPLDMRMGQSGESAADLVNSLPEEALADILFHYGEERAARRIARAIVRAREAAPIASTLQLAEIVAGCLPRPKPGQSHPATRSFQAIRIAVNAEFSELTEGLAAAERALKPGGVLAVVTFHSLEDRIVKRFFQARSGGGGQGSRYAPERPAEAPGFTLLNRKVIGPDMDELSANPRARSALLRAGRRSAAPAAAVDPRMLGVPLLPVAMKGRR